MTNYTRNLNRANHLLPGDLARYDNPLDLIHDDHLRERAICAKIDTLAGAERPDPETAARILDFLRHELPLFLADDEEDLFPLLRRRCKPEEKIGKVIERLVLDHRHADEDTPEVVADLEVLEDGDRRLSPEARARLVRFAGHARHHLILANAVVLPFARLRLTKDDLETLRLRMMQRRCLDPIAEKPDAQ